MPKMSSCTSPSTCSFVDELLTWLTDIWRRQTGTSERQAFLDRLAADGLLTLFGHHIDERNGTAPEISTTRRRQLGLRVAINRRETCRLLDLFGEQQIDAIVLKGEPLGRELFDDPHLRSTFDIDLLVDPSRFWSAVRLLEEDGYQRTTAYKPWAFNQLAFERTAPDIEVELHWQIAHPSIPTPSTAKLLEQARHVTVDETPVPVLGEAAGFLQLCYHFHQHLGFLKGLVDIAGWLDRDPDILSRPALLEMVDRLGLRGLVAWPLAVLESFCNRFSVPEVFRADGSVRLLATWTTRRIRRRYTTLEQNTSRRAVPEVYRMMWRVVENCASMAVLDGGHRKLVYGLKPLLLGPHRLGRAVGPVIHPLLGIEDPGPEPDTLEQ